MASSRITSRQNPRVKDAARLRTGGGRRAQGRIILDGAREILRAIDCGVACREAFVCEELVRSADGRRAVAALSAGGTEILHVSPEVYAKLAFGERDDGIVVVAVTPRRQLDELPLPIGPLVAVLDGIEKPGNLGAILRTADAAGVDAVVVADGRTDLFNPNTIRASLGTVFRANVGEASVAETVAWLGRRRMQIVAARPDAEMLYTDVDFRGSVAVVLGSEAAGLGEAWRGTNITPVRLPMRGIADSLNVSAAAAVLFYEASRQRDKSG